MPFVFASVSVFASVDQCESSSQQGVPSAVKRPALRVKPSVATAPVIGPKRYLTPLVLVRPFATPSQTKISTTSKFNCLTPISMPPGAIRIGYSTPYIGQRPEWGTPTPSYLASGPRPVYPGAPDDFRPSVYAPPGFAPPMPNDVPEPPTIALMLLGIFLMMRKSLAN